MQTTGTQVKHALINGKMETNSTEMFFTSILQDTVS